MKYFSLSQVLLVGGVLGLLSGCDVVQDPVEPTVTSSLNAAEQQQIDALDNSSPAPKNEQRVFLEDFTGQFCGNCPKAALIATQLKQQYGARVVAVGEHVTAFFAAPKAYPPYQLDYRVNPFSLELENALGLSSLPKGAVNRAPRPNSTNPVLEYADWAVAVQEELQRQPEQELQLTPQYDAATRTLRLKVSSQYLKAQPGRTFRLGVFISEDSLVGGQKDYDKPTGQQDITNYMHRHVLRAALLGTFGTVQATAPQLGQRFVNYLKYELPAKANQPTQPAWNTHHCTVVAYLADDATKRIVQVSEAHF